MKPEEINALWLTATRPPWEAGHPLDPGVYSLRQPELECWIPQDLNDSKTAAALFNAWPQVYRELMAARAWRDAINLRILVFNGVTVVSVNHDVNEIALVDAFDAARKETEA